MNNIMGKRQAMPLNMPSITLGAITCLTGCEHDG